MLSVLFHPSKIYKSLASFFIFCLFGFKLQVEAYENKYPLSLVRGAPLTYNITASHAQKFIWFRVAKVGTRTILNILEKRCPLSVNGFSVPYNTKEYEGFFKFAFVRNPWSRVVSCYFNKILTKCHPAFSECYDKDFAYFVDFINRTDLANCDPHIRLQTRLFPINELDFLGRFETFAEDLKFVLGMLNLDDAVIEHRNASKHEHYSHYYNEKTKNIIARKYKADIVAFDYKFEKE